MMFGREAVLPIDQVFSGIGGTSAEMVKTHQEFVADWEKSMKLAHDIARKNIQKSAEYNKQHYDKQARAAALQVGDQVLVQNMREKTGKKKMRSYYEENLFKVVETRAEIPVYKIQNMKKPKDVRVVHRNKLLKVDELPLDVFDDKNNSSKKRTERKTTGKKSRGQAVEERAAESVEKDHEKEMSDSDDDYAVVVEEQRVMEHMVPDTETVMENSMELSREEEDSDAAAQVDDSLGNTIEQNSQEDYLEATIPWDNQEQNSQEEDPDATIPWDDQDALIVEHDDGNVSSDFDPGGSHGSQSDLVVHEESAEEDTQSEGGSNVGEPGDEIDTTDDDDDEESPQPVRRTGRNRAPKHIFTYDKLGGNPVRQQFT